MTTTTAPHPRRRRWVTWRDGLCAGILLLLLVSTHWVTVNLSPSMPRGLYRYVRTEGPFHRDEIVRIPAVDFGRSWLASWLPLLKPITGIPGDTVCVGPEDLWVTQILRSLDGKEWATGIAYGAVYQEHRGQASPSFLGLSCGGGAGEVFVGSHEP